MRKVYLSLGSNKEDRVMYLQLAIGLIHYRVGTVVQISSLVETPAWGFDGASFYNACIALETSLSPQEVLDELLSIEQYLGRKRNSSLGYSDRTIDLDILFYEDEIIALPHLTIPHANLHKRNFVLAPFEEIAAEAQHPILRKTVKQLLKESPDTTKVTFINHALFLPKKRNFIAIEGNIGVGKTSFTHKLKEALNGTILLENFYDNPYLADFYQNPEKYALKVETAFLEDRIQQLNRFFKQTNRLPIIADFSLEKSLLFAGQNLKEKDLIAYREAYLNLSKNLSQPDVVLYLDQKIPQLQRNIEKRGRSFERDISDAYLQKIEQGYKEWQAKSQLNIKVLNTKGIDFVENPSAFYSLLLAFLRC